jgi:hypothetical protein
MLHTDDRQTSINKAIVACRDLIRTLSNPHIQPLEREAGHVLARALRIQVEMLGLLDNPDVQAFLRVEEMTRPVVNVRRYPQDFKEFGLK